MRKGWLSFVCGLLCLSVHSSSAQVSYAPIVFSVKPRTCFIPSNCSFPVGYNNPGGIKTSLIYPAYYDVLPGDVVLLAPVGDYAVGQVSNGTVVFGPEAPQPLLGLCFPNTFGPTPTCDQLSANGIQTAAPQFSSVPKAFLISPGGTTICIPQNAYTLAVGSSVPTVQLTQDLDANYGFQITPVQKIRFAASGNSRITISSTNVHLGDTFTLTLVLTNTGNVPAVNFTPNSSQLTAGYAGSVLSYLQVISGPTPSKTSVGAGEVVTIQTVLKATQPHNNLGIEISPQYQFCDGSMGGFFSWQTPLFNISGGLLTTVTASPHRVGVGDQIQVVVTTQNNLSDTLTNVQISGSIAVAGKGAVAAPIVFPPRVAATLGSGQIASFTNLFTATNYGPVQFTVTTTGTGPSGVVPGSTASSSTVVIAPRGDLLIKRDMESGTLFAGAGIYQTVPVSPQIKTNAVGKGEPSKFQVQVINHEKQPLTFTLSAIENSHPGWSMKYLLAGQDVTPQLEAFGGALLPPLAPDDSFLFDLMITPTNAIPGSANAVQFALGLASDPTATLDIVEAVSESATEIVVNSTGDLPNKDPDGCCCDTGKTLSDGTAECTLRAAIDLANRIAGKDIIRFQIPATDPNMSFGIATIQPETDLPHIQDPVVIDGTSQNPDLSTPPIYLSGRVLPKHYNTDRSDGITGWHQKMSGLELDSPNNEIRGLVISQFGFGLVLVGSGNTIQGCFIGTDPTGKFPKANGMYVTGIPQQPMLGCGILVHSPNNHIGGTALGQRNVISGQTGTVNSYSQDITGFDEYLRTAPPNIVLEGSAATGNLIEGNIIGLDATGKATLLLAPHDSSEGYILEADEGILIYRASRNVIGGTASGAANVISGNIGGVLIEGVGSEENIVIGNLIGTDIDGNELGKGGDYGIGDGGRNTQIGGFGSGEGNTLGSLLTGLSLEGVGTLVTGNRIGLPKRGIGDGIHLFGENIVVTSNTIAYSDTSGLKIYRGNHNTVSGNEFFANPGGITIYEGIGNRVSGNSIKVSDNNFKPAGIGLDLGFPEGITANDAGDFDSGPNLLQNYPDLFPVRLIDNAIKGKLSTSLGVRTYQIEFFANHASPQGHGPGERFLGGMPADTDLAGEAIFTFPLPPGITNGTFITATATDPDGNTSEFSKAVQACTGPDRDLDGICDDLENNVPNRNKMTGNSLTPKASRRDRAVEDIAGTGDGNGDGILDSQQANVCSLIGVSGQWITLAATNGVTLKNVTAGGPPDFANIPAGYTFPLGFVGFTIGGLPTSSATLVNYLFHDSIDYSTVFAYGPTPNNPQAHWYEFLFDGSVGAKLDVDQFTLTFVDGGGGDHDLTANGEITTILAPAFKIPLGARLSITSLAVGLGDSLGIDAATGALTTNLVPVMRSVLSWPVSTVNYQLQFTDDLDPQDDILTADPFSLPHTWQPVVDSPVAIAGQNVITNTATKTMRFYQLRPH